MNESDDSGFEEDCDNNIIIDPVKSRSSSSSPVTAAPEPTKLVADKVLVVLSHIKFADCKIDVAAFPINN